MKTQNRSFVNHLIGYSGMTHRFLQAKMQTKMGLIDPLKS